MILESFTKNYPVLDLNVSPVTRCIMSYLFSLMVVILVYGIIAPLLVTLGGWYTISAFVLWLIPIAYVLRLVQQEDIYLHHR